MFTGIVEGMGRLVGLESVGRNRVFLVEAGLSDQLRVDQSLAHDGVCLTVESVEKGVHRVTAVAETLAKTTLGQWGIGRTINLERSMVLGGRVDGHLVQGHVDAVGSCLSREECGGSWRYVFGFDARFAHLVIEKGSVCVNGVSLTAFDVGRDRFSVAVIPFTYEHTNLRQLASGHPVNLEFDMMGKYLARFRETLSDPAP